MTATIRALATWNSFDTHLDIITMAGGEITLTMDEVITAEREDLDPLTGALDAYYGAANWVNDGEAIASMPHHCEDGELISSLNITITIK